jgi:hypothetical protein
MGRINASVALKLIVALCCFTAPAMIRNAEGGEYFTYRDHQGKLVLSNIIPPAGSRIIKREALPEITDRELAESRLRNEKTGLDNRLASLEKSIDELSDNLHAQTDAIDSLQRSSSDGDIAVGVTQGRGIVTKPPREHFSRHPRNDFPKAQHRGTIPSPLQQRSGARGRS